MGMSSDYILQEFALAIERLVPLTPDEVTQEAQRLYADLSQNPATDEQLVRKALIEIGRKEFPYRKAYEELCANDEERRLQEATLARLSPALREKVLSLLQVGVSLVDYLNSQMFEKELTGTQRHEIEEAVLAAHDVINRQCDERAAERKQKYQDLVDRWRAYEERLQKKIEVIRSLAQRAHDADLAAEILDAAMRFEEGWSIVERDPTEEDVQGAYEDFATRVEEGEEEM